MAMEPGGKGLPIEAPARASASATTRKPREGSPAALDLQILSTEHWSLLATRSLSWTESFSRAQMFLSVLSGAVIALALVAQATAFGEGFTAFALVILPVVLFLGVATFIRLVAVNNDEGRWVIGMNRIRGAYLEIAPHLEPYFITGHHDDEKGLMVTGGWGDFPKLYGFVTTPAVVAVICGVVAGTIAFLAATQLHVPALPAAAIGVSVFVAAVVAANRYETASMAKAVGRNRPINPSPPDPQ